MNNLAAHKQSSEKKKNRQIFKKKMAIYKKEFCQLIFFLLLKFYRLEALQTKMDDFAEGQPLGLPSPTAGASAAGDASSVALPPPAAPAAQTIKQVIQMPPGLDQRLNSLEDQVQILCHLFIYCF